MKIQTIKKGSEAEAVAFLSNRTEEDFEAADSAVKKIISRVRKDGDRALYELTAEFGGPDAATVGSLRVSPEEMEEAVKQVEPEVLASFEKAADNIRRFHEKQLQKTWSYREGKDILLGQLIRPVKNVGITIPGGSAPLSSTVLMNVIPAKIAGCPRVIMCSPAGPDGKVNKYILAAAKAAGADEIYKAGGAQAIAAMAYGTESVKKVDKICGPGGMYVSRAKKYVFGTVDIDMIAGPSEVCIIADSSADPALLAADMLSQAEHDVNASSILITDDSSIAHAAAAETEKQLAILERGEIASESVKNNAAIFITEDLDSAFKIANEIAPEHLELEVENPEGYLEKVEYAGAVLLGKYSPEPLGDYIAGPNHTLPTSGAARFANPLGVYDFLTRTSIIHYSQEDLKAVKDDIIRMSDVENLTAHGNSIKIRFGQLDY